MQKIQEPGVSGVHIWLVLMKTFRSLDHYAAKSLRRGALGNSDFRVLEVLLHKGAMPVNAIGAKVFLTPGSISTAIERLHQRGFVSRVASSTDRRVQIVDLTAKGRALIGRIFAAHAADMEEVAGVLSPPERAQLIAALKKLGKNAEHRGDS